MRRDVHRDHDRFRVLPRIGELATEPIELLAREDTVVRVGVRIVEQDHSQPLMIEGRVDFRAEVLLEQRLWIVVAGNLVYRLANRLARLEIDRVLLFASAIDDVALGLIAER